MRGKQNLGIIRTIHNDEFWHEVGKIVTNQMFIVERAAGTSHPAFATTIYPLDYGYLEGTRAGDGASVDAWRGSLKRTALTGLILTIDTLKRDIECKLLIGCTPQEIDTLVNFHNRGQQSGLLMTPPPKGRDSS